MIIAVPKLPSSIPGPSKSKPSNVGTFISASRHSTSSSMALPKDAARIFFGDRASLPSAGQKPVAPVNSPSTSQAGSSSQRIKSFFQPPSIALSSKLGKLPAPAVKPKPSEDEIITISSDSDDDESPPPKRKPAVTDGKPPASSCTRKSTSGHQPRRSPSTKTIHDVIEILDSDDEAVNPRVAPGRLADLVNSTRRNPKFSKHTPTSKTPVEDGMDLDHPVPVAQSAAIDADTAMDPDRENNVPAGASISVDSRRTPAAPPTKPGHVTTLENLPSPQPQPALSSVKKPNRQGFNSISVPDQSTPPPSANRRPFQIAVKSASGSLKRRETLHPSSSASPSTGGSESGTESSKPNSPDSMSDAAPDLPNLTHALRIRSTGHSSPEPQAPKKSPAPSDSRGKSAPSIDPKRTVSHAAAESSKVLANMLSELKSNRSLMAASASSSSMG